MAEPVEQDNMLIEWDVEIIMDDGLVLRADVFRPKAEGKCPVLLTYVPYAKGLAFQQGYPSAWQNMIANHPDVAHGSTNKYQNWEVVDPEKWVPQGYACVRVDSRGTGRSPGNIDHFSPRETRDFYQCIEWAGVQSWSNGNVGLNGISYYAINQWQVACLQPPHLKAMCIWEGAADWYRDMTHHGGILSTFWANWYDMQVKTVQYGLGERGPRSQVTGALVCGDETMSDEELAHNRSNFGDDILAHPLDDEYHQARSPDWDKVTVPLLSAANWGGQGLHARGNLKDMFERRQRTSGSSAMGWSIGRISTPITGVNCKSASSISISKAKPTIGHDSRKFSCRSGISIGLSCGMKPPGHYRLRSGPNSTLTRGIRRFPCSRPLTTRRSASPRWVTG
jgi:putative CocE/NonD family hydrolase